MGKAFGISESFVRRADSAAFYEAWVGSVLARAGLFTTHHPFTIADSKYDIHTYSQTWDLDVGAVSPTDSVAGQVSTEVKSLSAKFSATKDYPYNTVLVCSQASFQRKWPKASTTGRDFLMVSRETGAIVWIPKGSPIDVGHEVFDPTRRELYKVITTERKHLRELYEFVEYVKEHHDKQAKEAERSGENGGHVLGTQVPTGHGSSRGTCTRST